MNRQQIASALRSTMADLLRVSREEVEVTEMGDFRKEVEYVSGDTNALVVRMAAPLGECARFGDRTGRGLCLLETEGEPGPCPLNSKGERQQCEFYKNELAGMYHLANHPGFQMDVVSKTHHLKTWPCSFDPMKAEVKTFDYRKNDRNFHVGDALVFKRYDPHTQGYTGEVICRRVTYIILGGDVPGLPEGYCIMQIAKKEESDGARAEGGGQV